MPRKLTSKVALLEHSAQKSAEINTLIVWWLDAQKPSRAHITAVLTAFMTDKFSLSLGAAKDQYEISFLEKLDLTRAQELPSFCIGPDGMGRVTFRDLERAVGE